MVIDVVTEALEELEVSEVVESRRRDLKTRRK